MEVTISGKLISYDVIGNGAPILFIHGWGGDKNALSKLAQRLQLSNRCYLIDLPGFGESENPNSDWGLNEYADLVRKFILDLNISPVIYIGHSFGGALGIRIASENADIISKLVVISPSYRRMKTNRSKNFEISSIRKLLWPVRKLFYRILYPSSVALKYVHLESNFRRIVSTDLSDSIEEIKCPTLILWPADDIEMPLNDAYVLNDGIEGATLKVFGGYNHDLPIKQPEVIADNIKEFIS